MYLTPHAPTDRWPPAEGDLSPEAGAPDISFRSIWFEEWGFCDSGKPEDAAAYLEGVLRAVAGPRSPTDYLENIGGIDGQQEFMFQWLRSVGLVERSGRDVRLTTKGHNVLVLFEAGTFYREFDVEP